MRNFIPYFIQDQYQKRTYEGHFEALTMFVDVSGFTPLTQALMKEGHEGAEILAMVLNAVFDKMIDAVYKRGGFISGFAGDAFTAVFPRYCEENSEHTFALQVLACAERMQAIFRRYGIQTTPFGRFTLRVKVGVSHGNVEWGITGSPQKLYFFRGEAIDSCAASEHSAKQGEIVFDAKIAQIIPEATISSERIDDEHYRLQKLPASLTRHVVFPKRPRRNRLRQKVILQFFPKHLVNFTDIGEFRNVVSIFISFKGISTLEEFDTWASILLENIRTFSGYFNRMNFGDKGGFVLCGFGAPVAFENMIERALDFILAVKKDLKSHNTLSDLKFRAGITYGIAYAGITGGKRQCEYTYHGEVVNLAARFMMQAEWEEIFVSKVMSGKATNFRFAYKGDFPYKGITEPVPTYVLLGRKAEIKDRTFSDTMIGRQEELQRLQEFASPIFGRKFAGIAYIYGEAGIGKSRLAYALREALTQQHDIAWFTCVVDQILRKSFNPFTTCLIRYFDQSSEKTEEENTATFEKKYQALIEKISQSPLEGGTGGVISKELIRTQSILGAQLGLFWQGSLWDHLDAKGKYENTLYAIKNFFLAHSLVKPVVIEFEDSHWIDDDSLALFQVFTRNISDYPIFLLSTSRYHDDGTKSTFHLDGVTTCEIDLNYLSVEDVRRYAAAELQGNISDTLYAFFVEKTKGNPFFVQQIARYVVEQEVINQKEETWHLISDTLNLPDTISAVLMARIDRLTDQVKELVKMAAVIGREFDILLLSLMLKQDIRTQIKMIEESQIWQELRELQYMFKHALLRDIAYEMQLRARLRELHQLAAEAMETLYATHLADKYADIAFHYEKAEMSDKAREYLERAGDEAKARYQNHQALGFYDRLLSHLKGDQHLSDVAINTLLKKGEILNLIGEWKTCQQVCEETLCLAEQRDDPRRVGKAKLALGIVFRGTGKYENAMIAFKQAMDLFEAVNENEGLGQACKEMGIISRRKGDYTVAMGWYERALKICEEEGDILGMAKNANNIGIVYDMQGEYETAMQWYHKSFQASEALGEKVNLSNVVSNMGENRRLQGDCEVAMTYYEKALTLTEELGDRLYIAVTLGNIGHVYTAQGEYRQAIETYDRAIAIGRELKSPFYLGEHLIGKAEAVFALQRYAEAQALNQEGLRIAQEVGNQEYIARGNALSVKIASAIENREK